MLSGYAKNNREREELIVFLLSPSVYGGDENQSDYDHHRVNELLKKFENPDEVYAKCKAEAVDLLFQPGIRRKIEALADVLLVRETLACSEVYEILDRVAKVRKMVTTLDFSSKLNGELSGTRTRTKASA